MSFSQKIKHGIKWQFIANMAAQIIYFGNGIILARILGPKEFGIYGMSQILSNFVFTFWNLGLNAAIVQKKEINDNHLHTTFTISVLSGFVCFVFTWFSAPYLAKFFNEPQVMWLTRLIGITFIIYAFDRVPSALLSRNMKFKEASTPGILNALFYGIFAIPLALAGAGVFSFAVGIIAGTLAMLVIRFIWLFKFFKWRPKLLFDKKCAKDLLGFGTFITLSNMTNFFLGNLQRIITGKFLGASELGYLGRASNLSYFPISKVQSSVGGVLLPAFSKIQNDNEKIKDWFKKFNFFTYLVVSPPLIFFCFFPNIVIGSLFGEKWLSASPLLTYLALSTLITVSNMYFSHMINGKGKPHILFVLNIFRLIPLVVFLLIGVKFGVLGVAIALLFNSIVSIMANLFVIKKYIGLQIRDFIISLFEPVLVSLIAASILFPLRTLEKDIGHIFTLLVIGTLFSLCVFGYYFYRWQKKSYIKYLGFDLKDVVKLDRGGR